MSAPYVGGARRPATVPAMDVPRSPAASAIVVFLLTCAAGVVAAYTIGASLTYDFDGETAMMTAQPLDGARKTFNWLIFCLFGATGIIAGAVAWAGVLVNNVIIEANSKQLNSLARLNPAPSLQKSSEPSLKPGPPFGVKPSADLDPPHL
jgi:hypothetical protein